MRPSIPATRVGPSSISMVAFSASIRRLSKRPAIGFAVPAHTVAEIAPELIETGTITRATIGAQIEIRRSRTSSGDEIAILKTVDGKSPLRPGDLLREFAGRSMKRRGDLMRVLRRDIIGREVPIVIERDGKAHELSITPQRRPN